MSTVNECLRQVQPGELMLADTHYLQIVKLSNNCIAFIIRCLHNEIMKIYDNITYSSTNVADVRYIANYLIMNKKQVNIENYELPSLPPLEFQIDTVKFIDTAYNNPIAGYRDKIDKLHGLGRKEIESRESYISLTTYRNFVKRDASIIAEINTKINKGKIFNGESIFNIENDKSLFYPYYIEGYLYFKSLDYSNDTEIKLLDIQTQILLTAKLGEIHKKIIKCKEKKRQLKDNLRYLLNNVFPQIS